MSNAKFIKFEYGNSNIFSNFEDVGFTLMHSSLICVVIMSLKALYTIAVFNYDYKTAFNEGGAKSLKARMKKFTMKKLEE